MHIYGGCSTIQWWLRSNDGYDDSNDGNDNYNCEGNDDGNDDDNDESNDDGNGDDNDDDDGNDDDGADGCPTIQWWLRSAADQESCALPIPASLHCSYFCSANTNVNTKIQM